MSTISERINEALRTNGMKQIDLSRKTGINRSNISYYCSGEYEPKGNNLHKIAEALNVSVAWLIGVDSRSAVETETDDISEINRLASQLNQDNQKLLADFAAMLLKKQ